MSPDRFLELVNEDIAERTKLTIEDLQTFLGRDAIINWGKYKGRLGQITWIGIQSDICGIPQVHVMCQPYLQRRHGLKTVTSTTNLLWDHKDARSYVPVCRVSIIE